MPRRAIHHCENDDTIPPLRRSVRILQQQQQPHLTTVRRERTKGTTSSLENTTKKRKRETKEEDCNVKPAVLKRSSRAKVPIQPSTESNKPAKRGVRFGDNEPLEALPDDCVAEEDAARAAAAAVTPEFLAGRPENAQYASLGICTMPCPPDAVAKIAPSRTRDSKGRVLLQYPIRYILAYRIEIGDLYDHLKSVKRDFYDFQGTLLALQIKLDELLNMRHGEGLSEMMYNGKRIWTMIMSQSDRPETLPYPTARIQKFQEIVGCTSPPLVHAYRPTAHRLKAGAK
ncbi:uncharacterized protein SCHCODRAFT_02694296 [Schizophyllum commune H4-8]|nr:uncharacterized protein SCHCODRAFT_02694296 [Schizophyllum commune H4-8]KAI5884926.1 hypothetical protein SCHCODRAFT_02694296 [Schizophyllum commune H4-8]